MASIRVQRAISLVLAIIFAASTIGIVAYYVLANKQAEKEQATLTAIQEQLKNQQQQSPDTKKLQGTKLENFQPLDGVSSLQKIDLTAGTGDTVQAGDNVTVDYTGALAKDGTIFQSSLDSGSPIPLEIKSGSVIDGWAQGIPGMKVGGVRRLIIPAKLAYGSASQAGIPANSDLVFDVKLIKINK
jgi:FKBP-type peptidyl-prolyl cis-trans isomerase FkpA